MKTLLGWKFALFAFFCCKMRTRANGGVAAAVSGKFTPVPTGSSGAGETPKQDIPRSFDASFGTYPNLLKITPDERESFSPVVFFPETITGRFNSSRNKEKIDKIAIKDHRQSSGELASLEDIEGMRIQKGKNLFQRMLTMMTMQSKNNYCDLRPWEERWGIGKYDENRDGGMYDSDLFDDLDNTIDGYGGRRTVHLGIDLGGPVGTPVHAFCDGIVHSVGYNPERGDYGYVMVVEHLWGDPHDPKRCWALYGHLDESVLTSVAAEASNDTSRGWRKFLLGTWKQTKTLVQPGDSVQKGQVIANMGGIDENGGWIHSHLHFQLSTKPPDQPHDMPGASSVKDRVEALQQYPDPRYVLGPMY